MAKLHTDSMACYGSLADVQANQAYSSVNGVYVPNGGLDGNGAFRLSDVSHGLILPLNNESTIITGFYFRPEVTFGTSRSDLLRFMVGSQEQLQLEIESTGRLAIYRGNSKLGESTLSLTLNLYYNLGIRVFISDASGAVTIKVNGVDWLVLSGVDTKRRTEAYANSLEIRGAGTPRVEIDDLYVFNGSGTSNNNIAANKKITVYKVAADTAQKDMVASSGSANYAMLDEGVAGPNNADYVTGMVGDQDMYSLETIDSTITDINLVNIVGVGRKKDVGDRTYNLVANPGGGEVLSPNKNLTVDFLRSDYTLEVNPDTGLPFTPAEIQAMTVGFKVTP